MDNISATRLLECHPHNPFRPPDWRWRPTDYLVENPRFRRRWVDDWARRAARFRRLLLRHGDASHKKVVAFDPALAAAYLLKSEPGPRLVVEASLLAGESYAAVASRVGLDATVVEAYERVFYAVSDLRSARDWVLFTAIPGLYGGATGPDDAALTKFFAYLGGPFVLDLLLEATGMRPAPAGAAPPATVALVQRAFAARRLLATGSGPVPSVRLARLVDELEARGAEADLSALVQPVEPGNDWLMADAADRRDGECAAIDVDQEAAVWRTA
jgi:hypothetical protein